MKALLFVARWLALSAFGLLAYACLRAVYAVVYLGTPLFDWVWYLPTIGVMLGILLCLAFPVLWKRATIVTLVSITAVSCLLYGGGNRSIVLYPDQYEAVPISFWTGLDFRNVPDSLLEDIHAAGGYVYTGRGDGSYRQPAHDELAAGLRRLDTYHIKAYLIPPLSKFLSVPVEHEWEAHVRNAAEFVGREQLHNVMGVIGDAENPQDVPLDIWATDRSEFAHAIIDFGNLNETNQYLWFW